MIRNGMLDRLHLYPNILKYVIYVKFILFFIKKAFLGYFSSNLKLFNRYFQYKLYHIPTKHHIIKELENSTDVANGVIPL